MFSIKKKPPIGGFFMLSTHKFLIRDLLYCQSTNNKSIMYD